jgi:hypothetical protein
MFLMAHSRRRRNLASMFIGEITAALEIIAGGPLKGDELRLRTFCLPRLTVYESTIDRLSLFDASLQRELCYFYTRLMALRRYDKEGESRTRRLADDTTQEMNEEIAEITGIIQLGEDLLHHFRKLVCKSKRLRPSR